MSDTRHRQLSRIYGKTIETDRDARAAVTSLDSARTYLEDRIAFFGDLASAAAGAVRTGFEERLHAWA